MQDDRKQFDEEERPHKPRRRKRRRRTKSKKEFELIISDHAVVRYYERVKGLNTMHVIQAILTPKLLEQYRTLGDGIYPVGTAFRVVIENKTVVTILPNKDEDIEL